MPRDTVDKPNNTNEETQIEPVNETALKILYSPKGIHDYSTGYEPRERQNMMNLFMERVQNVQSSSNILIVRNVEYYIVSVGYFWIFSRVRTTLIIFFQDIGNHKQHLFGTLKSQTPASGIFSKVRNVRTGSFFF